MSTVARWREVPLLEVCTLNPRNSSSANDLSVDYVDYAGIDDETGEIVKISQRMLADLPEGTATFFQGDVLFASVTSGQWVSAIVGELPRAIAFGPHMNVLRPGAEVSALYLWHFFQQPWLRQQAARRNTTTHAQPSLPYGFFRNLHIALPSIDEQRYIVDCLEQASARPYRAATRRVLHLKRELATHLMLPAAPQARSNWTLLTLADIVAINPKNNKPELGYAADTEVAFFAERDLLAPHPKPTSVRFHDMPNPGREVHPGDLLLGAHPGWMTYGRVGVVPPVADPLFAARTLTVLRPKERVSAGYLAALFSSTWFDLMVTPERPLNDKNLLGRIKVPLPPLSEQLRILRVLDAVPVEAIKHAVEKSRVLYHALARDAFNGMLSRRWRAPAPKHLALSIPHDDIDTSDFAPASNTAFKRSYRPSATQQLSMLQRLIWRAIRGRSQPLIVDDPESFEAFCSSRTLAPLHEYVSPNQIRRTLAQLCALGLIQQISLAPRGKADAAPYLAAFRAYRQSTHERIEEGLAFRDAHALRGSILTAELGL